MQVPYRRLNRNRELPFLSLSVPRSLPSVTPDFRRTRNGSRWRCWRWPSSSSSSTRRSSTWRCRRSARDLDFAQDDLSWVVNAYTLFFGGFLLLGGRMADLLGRRRLFIARPRPLRRRLARRWSRHLAGHADRRARGPGPRRRAALAGRALARHRDLHRGRRAQQGDGRLGRGRRLRRRRRRAARRRAHRVRRLGVGAVRQRADRPRGRARSRRACCPRAATRARATSTSPARSR